MRERRRARSWALQVLYAWDLRGGGGRPREVVAEFMAEGRISQAYRPYLRTLIAAVDEHLPEIDHALDGALTNWRLERLSAIDRNILRIGAAELLFIEDVPPRVAIQQGIQLAERYGTAESPRFVNGVLDALLRRESGRGAR